MSWKKRRLFLGWTLSLLTFGAISLGGSFLVIRFSTRGKVYEDAENVPLNDVGLVLGTSKYTRGHVPNPHFDHRMDKAALLYRSGCVRHLLLSGDNGSRGYNEPADMQAALLALGVPAEAMTLDDAGFRTLDSVVRAKRVFGQQHLTIITDRFHAYRAVFLAQREGIDTVAVPSEDVGLRYSFRSKVRESFADVKACLDVWVLHTQPKFLGEPIPVHVASR